MTCETLVPTEGRAVLQRWNGINPIGIGRKRFPTGWRVLLWSCSWLAGGPLQAAEVRLAWDPSPDPDVTGYRLHWGTQSRNYTRALDVGLMTTATVRELSSGFTYFFAATAYTADGRVSDFSNEVGYTVPEVSNRPPALTAPANRIIAEDTSTGPLAFTVSDPDHDAAGLVVSVVSSNPTLVPAGGLVLGGSGAHRTLSVTPARHQTGTALITVRVSDGQLSAARSFELIVSPAALASWQRALLGEPEAGGDSQVVDGQFFLDAAGRGIGGSADEGMFFYQTLVGDGTLTVRLNGWTSNALTPQAGVMLRRGLHPSAPMLFWHATPYVLLIQQRSEAGQTAVPLYIGVPQPAPDNWFRMVRTGNTVSTYFSRDGVNWRAAWTPLSGDWSGEVQVGLAAASGYSWRRATAVLEQVTLSR